MSYYTEFDEEPMQHDIAAHRRAQRRAQLVRDALPVQEKVPTRESLWRSYDGTITRIRLMEESHLFSAAAFLQVRGGGSINGSRREDWRRAFLDELERRVLPDIVRTYKNTTSLIVMPREELDCVVEAFIGETAALSNEFFHEPEKEAATGTIKAPIMKYEWPEDTRDD